MKEVIKAICENTHSVYRKRLENEHLKVDLWIKYLKPLIFEVLEENSFQIHLISITEKLKKDTNKRAQKNDFLNFMAKYNIDALSIGNKWILWSVFTHSVIPTKKNNRQIYFSFAWRNIIKKIYWKIPADQFIKKLFNMQFSGWKTLFIDSTERFKKVEKKLLWWLFIASSIPNFYAINEKDKSIYFCNRQDFFEPLWNIPTKRVKILLLKEKDQIHNLLKQYLNDLYWIENRKKIEVMWSFLNSYSNLKDLSNMIEGPNDIMQERLKKMWVAYDDSFIKRIIIDDIITDKRLEGFFLFYKNLKKKNTNFFKMIQTII